jgi:hypothetical protein
MKDVSREVTGERLITHLEDEPPSKVDTTYGLRAIRKSWINGNLSAPGWQRPSDMKCSKEGNDGQDGQHVSDSRLRNGNRTGKERTARREGGGKEWVEGKNPTLALIIKPNDTMSATRQAWDGLL